MSHEGFPDRQHLEGRRTVTAELLLQELSRLGVKVHREGDKLLFIDPKRALTPALKAELRMHRAGIMAALQSQHAASAARERPALEVVASVGDRAAKLVVRADGKIVTVALRPDEMADLTERLLDAGGRKALAKRQGIL